MCSEKDGTFCACWKMTKTLKKEQGTCEDVDMELQTPKTGRTGDGGGRETRERMREGGGDRHREAGRRHKEIRKRNRKQGHSLAHSPTSGSAHCSRGSGGLWRGSA